MNKIMKNVLPFIICILLIVGGTMFNNVNAAVLLPVAKPNINLSSMYTYDNMSSDIALLSQAYPDTVHYSIIGTTALGRDIYCVSLGNMDSAHHIMVQASIHAREYLCTQMCMKMIEYYAENEKDLLKKICFDIVPMSNPDGVSIAQLGTAAATNSKSTQEFIKAAGHTSSWKSNAMGVDLNRNFDIGWAAINQGVNGPSFEKYKGVCAGSEAETKALVALASARQYDAFISYHMQGGIIYYDEPGNTAANSAASKAVANAVHSTTGYKLKSLKASITTTGSVVQGGFNDWVQIAFNKPGITVEVGNSLPPKEQKNMTSIYKRNLTSWKAVAKLYVK